MPEAIYLEDSLVARLRASARNVSPEELVEHVLMSELDRLDTSEAWQRLNSRRLALIEKSSPGKLTAAEGEELEKLQTTADRWFEEQDEQLLEELRRCLHTIEALPEQVPS